MSLVSDPVTSRPTFLLVNGVDRHRGRAAVSAERASAMAEEFLAANGSEFGIASVADELKVERIEADRLGLSHVRYQQLYKGLPVRYGEVFVHLNAKGEVYAVNGKFARDIALSTSPAIDSSDAKHRAILQCQYDYQPSNLPEAFKTELVVLPLGIVNHEGDDDTHLAWEIRVTDNEAVSATYFVDAMTGAVLKAISDVESYNRTVKDCSARQGLSLPCQVDYVGDSTYPDYTFGRSEGQPPRGPNPREETIFYGSLDVDDCYDHLGVVHSYLLTRFGRDGANGQGGMGSGYNCSIDCDPCSLHRDYIWSYCPCYAAMFMTWDVGLYFCHGMTTNDVVGHEYTHAILWNVFSHNSPVYSGETGALDEGYADFFGEHIEREATGSNDWGMGTGACSGILRDLARPLNSVGDGYGPHPDRSYNWRFYCGGDDNGGVHYNSTVPSHAMYLMEVGGELNGCYVSPLGTDTLANGYTVSRSEQIWYRAWTTYFTSTVNFNEAYTGVLQAAADLYDSSVVRMAETALQAVEMDQPGLCSGIAERAPACAVHSAGMVSCDSVAYGVITVEGMGGCAGRMVTADLVAHPAVDSIWRAIPWLRQSSDTVGADGRLQLQLTADTVGVFDLVVDENSDGFYQPWADTILTVHVIAGAVQHLVAQYAEPNRIRLSWQALSGATRYAVESDSTLNFAVPAVIGTVGDTVFVDSLSTATHLRLFYRVRAVGE